MGCVWCLAQAHTPRSLSKAAPTTLDKTICPIVQRFWQVDPPVLFSLSECEAAQFGLPACSSNHLDSVNCSGLPKELCAIYCYIEYIKRTGWLNEPLFRLSTYGLAWAFSVFGLTESYDSHRCGGLRFSIHQWSGLVKWMPASCNGNISFGSLWEVWRTSKAGHFDANSFSCLIASWIFDLDTAFVTSVVTVMYDVYVYETDARSAQLLQRVSFRETNTCFSMGENLFVLWLIPFTWRCFLFSYRSYQSTVCSGACTKKSCELTVII